MQTVYKTPGKAKGCEECIFYSTLLRKCMLPPIAKGVVEHCSELAYVKRPLEHNGHMEIEACLPSVDHFSLLVSLDMNNINDMDKNLIKSIKSMKMVGCAPVFEEIEGEFVKTYLSCKCVTKAYVFCDKKHCSVLFS
ncbi:hypothetical protein IPA_01030 [Ignicoccus pacificus DSM 13166]|uniref:Uncharacterized protein n=1 Tax=Ignicoccus pacificus DSM 13166 TaxID=940294 RepID=A0A977PL75_9CREN|nr:hypothetical protein IPA_01030 [Ignicoccus pacificus DSM 13166]